MNVIKPTRAFYLCDKWGCRPEWPYCMNDECKHTTDVNHAKNGPVVNLREWDTRFKLQEIDGLLYYWEIESEE